MKKIMIYNAVPAYKKAPASLELLKNDPSIIFADMDKKPADTYFVILPVEESGLKETLMKQSEEFKIGTLKCINANVTSNFTYLNSSALYKVVEGEKAIPSSNNSSDCVVQITDLKAEKCVYMEGPDDRIIKVKPKAGETLRSILEKSLIKVDEVKAIYLGHPMGNVLDMTELDKEIEVRTDFIKVIGKNQCMLDALLKIAEVHREETCGRCVFGHEGTAQINMVLSDIAQRKGKTSDLDLLLGLCGIMKSQTMCEIGSSLAMTVRDAILKFREEIEMHVMKRTCLAGVCSKFVTYHILADKCVGCTDCIDACDEEAIKGRKRFIHVIDQEECTQCGACVEACGEEAIVKAGAVKPRCPQRPIPCKQ